MNFCCTKVIGMHATCHATMSTIVYGGLKCPVAQVSTKSVAPVGAINFIWMNYKNTTYILVARF